jgi:hypothetical protein
MDLKYYAGIGSRRTPEPMLEIMTKIAKVCQERGYILRSGGAAGADTAFEAGANSRKEIFLPWKGFNKHTSNLFNLTEEGYTLAEQFHPAWKRCSDKDKKFHVRNCYQVLGYHLNDPVYFVMCWTPNGSGLGGTGQAIRIAKHYRIPVYDLGDYEQLMYVSATFPWEKE